MRFLLRLKHWQLFTLVWGIPFGLNILLFFDTGFPIIAIFPVMTLLFTIGVYGWIWGISIELHKKLPADVKLNVGQFKIVFTIPIVYMLALTFWMINNIFSTLSGHSGENGENMNVIGIIIFIHLLSMVCIILGLRFAAKTMKSVELGRMANFGDYVGEFFLIWFSPVGVWILQPRLNKLTDD